MGVGCARSGDVSSLSSSGDELQLSNHRLRVMISSRGASLGSVAYIDSQGRNRPCVIGHDLHLDRYLPEEIAYAGFTIGRFANRIRDRLVIDGSRVSLSGQQAGVALHGGRVGWSHAKWVTGNLTSTSAEFHHRSPHGDQGFPGEVDATVAYRIRDAHEEGERAGILQIAFSATTTAPTVISLTNHAYWNLGPHGETVDSHRLQVGGPTALELDEAQLPTGRFLDVETLGCSAEQLVPIGSRILDHAVLLGGPPAFVDGELNLAARLRHEDLQLTVHSTAPCVQIYTGEALGMVSRPRGGLAIEPQEFPDAPNLAGAPSVVVMPGERYEHLIEYRIEELRSGGGTETAEFGPGRASAAI